MHNYNLILDASVAAEEAAKQSKHPNNRIGAAIIHPENPLLLHADCNHVPSCLDDMSPMDKIGASSPTLHAELTAAFAYKGDLRGSYLCCTDPLCPNCTKYVAELGIKKIFIASDGLKGDFATRRNDAFHNMSLLIAKRAGMAVGLLHKQSHAIDWLIPPSLNLQNVHGDYALSDSAPLEKIVSQLHTQSTQGAWACANIEMLDKTKHGLIVYEALPPGITPDDVKSITDPEIIGKYRFPIDPVTRLLLISKRMQYKIIDLEIGSGLIPSSRALVNAVGFGIQTLHIASDKPDHDPQAQDALDALIKREALKVYKKPVSRVARPTKPAEFSHT